MDIEMRVDAEFAAGIERVKQKLRALESGSAPSWFPELAKFEAQQSEQMFATNGAKSAAKWPDLLQGEGNMKGYVAWKRRNWGDAKINVWRGDTRDSFRHITNPDHIARFSGGMFEFGSRAKLAKQMHEGQSGGWKVAYLHEKQPRFRKGKGAARSRAAGGSNWFRFRFKTVPPRPLVNKSDAQIAHLKLALAKQLVGELAHETTGRMSIELAKAMGQMRPDPRK